MNKLWVVFSILFVSGWASAEQIKTVFNPFTSKPDYITKVDSSTISPGSTAYVQVGPSGTQTGAFNMSSGTVNGPFTVQDAGGGTAQLTLQTLTAGHNVSRLRFLDINSPQAYFGYDNAAGIGTGTGLSWWNSNNYRLLFLDMSSGTLIATYNMSASSANFTYNTSVGSLTITGGGDWPVFTPASDNNNYRMVGSSAAPTVGHFVVFSSTNGALIDAGIQATFGSATSTSFGSNPYVTINSSSSSQNLLITMNGAPGGGAQNQLGGITMKSMTVAGPPATHLVSVDSTTDLQEGSGIWEIWEHSPTHNDPLIWIHNDGQQSNPFMRIDDLAPDMELIATSTDNAHGRGKWEPMAMAYQSARLQINSRAWDNTTFENVAYWEPLSIVGAGLYLAAQTLANDSGVLTSSDTLAINFFTQNNRTVGLTGPLNTTASWTFALPSTFNNLGHVLYQSSNGRGNNNNARQWEFTAGTPVAGQFLAYTGGAPIWTNTAISSFTANAGMSAVGTGIASLLNVSTATTGPYILNVSSFGAGAVHFQDHTSSPTLTSCGTGPTIVGTNNAFTITAGATATGCTITFSPGTFVKVPVCIISQQSMSVVNALSYTTTAAAVTITQTGLGGNKVDLHCFGRD